MSLKAIFPKLKTTHIQALQRDLLAWFALAAADLPWRRTHDPYRIWLSEIMLQQTQVATVIPYYERFLDAFPTVEGLASTPLDRVLKLWEGLGYYSRARHLHQAAQKVVQDYGGQFPPSSAELLTLPGIGRYTAGAIASIAFGESAAVLDGNVMRVLSRLFDISEPVTETAVRNDLWALAEHLVPADRPGDYNQAVMELGREICKPRSPLCNQCPVAAHCLAFQRGVQGARPIKAPRARTPHYAVAAGIVWNKQGQVLIAQRPAEGLLGGLWEFPGGKREEGESLAECLARELREELGIGVAVGEQLTVVKHAFTHFRITLHAFECKLAAGEPQAIQCDDWRWVELSELDQFAFGHADRQVAKVLREVVERRQHD
ncbi:MAG TPA: A/G-specific adenine glycosylase [Aggregatilineales bacterium]|nr:A/G-specific adenine glycosylase [Aggregatilineales bacterium]